MPVDMPPRLRAVIFDCDGTLVDSEPLGLAAIAEAAQSIGVPLAAGDLVPLQGRSMAQCLALIEARHGRPLPADFEGVIRACMAEAFRRELQPMPGARELLERLPVPFCIASNGPREKMDLTLSVTGLMPLCAGRIFSAYEVGAFKPDPGLFLHAAAALGVAPSDCLVVEDTAPGVEAALAAGMAVCLLRSAHPLPAPLRERAHGIDHLLELLALPLQP